MLFSWEEIMAVLSTCGKFTVMGDLCKSLPWIQRNVRADTISIPGHFTNVQISYKEVIDLLLDTPWTCANQTRNVEPVKIELESIQYWKWFIKILIKKFRTLTTIGHTTPTIEFAFSKYPYEKANLDFLAWNPEVVNLKPEDSQGAAAACLISNGRNRMDIAIFERPDDKFEFSRLPIFSYGYRDRTKATYDVSVKLYTNQSAIPSRKKVLILDDTWLEAIKFLKFPQWSKALFVSCQLAGVVQSNLSCLPRIIFESAYMSEMTSMCSSVVAFDDIIPENEEMQFFMEFGIYVPAEVQHENTVIGLSKNSYSEYPSIEISLRGVAQHMQGFNGPLISSAEFSKHKEYCWAALKYFIKFLYYPAVYTKEVSMFAFNPKMADDLFGAEECSIRCDKFTLKRETELSNVDELSKSLSWLERNVRANAINFPEHIDYRNENIYELIANFVMDASWKCAHQEVDLKCISNAHLFVKALVQKFQTVYFVRNNIPTFTAYGYGNDETMSFLLLDPNVLKLESEDSESTEVYVISNGDNRMQIEIFKRYNSQERDLTDYGNYFEDSEEEHENLENDDGYVRYDDDDRKRKKEGLIDVFVKVFNV